MVTLTDDCAMMLMDGLDCGVDGLYDTVALIINCVMVISQHDSIPGVQGSWPAHLERTTSGHQIRPFYLQFSRSA